MEFIGTAAIEDDGSAMLGQPGGEAMTDSAIGSGNQDPPSRKIKQVLGHGETGLKEIGFAIDLVIRNFGAYFARKSLPTAFEYNGNFT
jgi:hypothetical protein